MFKNLNLQRILFSFAKTKFTKNIANLLHLS